jgi:hypothetical protein
LYDFFANTPHKNTADFAHVSVNHSPAERTGFDHLRPDYLQFFWRKVVDGKLSIEFDKVGNGILEVQIVSSVHLGLDVFQEHIGKFRYQHVADFATQQR